MCLFLSIYVHMKVCSLASGLAFLLLSQCFCIFVCLGLTLRQHTISQEGNIVHNLRTSAVLDLRLAHKISLLVFGELSCPTVFLGEYASIARLCEWGQSTLRVEGASIPVRPAVYSNLVQWTLI